MVAAIVYLSVNALAEKPIHRLLATNASSLQVFSAIEQLKVIRQTPKIVLVGSSLMKSPMWEVDSRHSLADAQFQTYHQARWFQEEIEKSEGRDVDVFSLAADGATTSDVYLMCDKLLKGSRCPRLIIYGVAARDIIAGLYGERNDPAFKLLFEPSDCRRLGDLFTVDLQERIELELSERLPLYKNRRVVQDQISRWDQTIKSGFLAFVGRSAIDHDKSSELVIANLGKRETCTIEDSWARLFKNQKACLSSLATLAKRRNCSLLLVNMPMAKGSFRGTKIYDSYLKTLDSCSQSPNTFLLDLADNDVSFRRDSFLQDGRHLNAAGGEQLIIRLTEWIKDHKEILSTHSS
jgi:hypothetical protein